MEKLIDINAIRSREDLIKPPKKQIGQLDRKSRIRDWKNKRPKTIVFKNLKER